MRVRRVTFKHPTTSQFIPARAETKNPMLRIPLGSIGVFGSQMASVLLSLMVISGHRNSLPALISETSSSGGVTTSLLINWPSLPTTPQ
jgi:hypothetical protein